MLEILFNESAAAGLIYSQTYKKGVCSLAAIGVIGAHEDGQKATSSGIKKTMEELEEKERRAREMGVAFDGNLSDIFTFQLFHSVGSLTGSGLLAGRRSVLERLFLYYPWTVAEQATKEMINRAEENLEKVRKRLADGEPVRIWYSSQPDEMCGLHWFASCLREWQITSTVLTVCQPDASGENQLFPSDILNLAQTWDQLKKENAPLRAIVNGRLRSVSEDFYDDLIYRELALCGREFHEGKLIGRILGAHHPTISDGWIAERIQRMIESGDLSAVTQAPADHPSYSRILKKNRQQEIQKENSHAASNFSR